MLLKWVKNFHLLLPTLFTLCIYCNMAEYFSSGQNQYHINFPNKRRSTSTMNRKLHLHPGNFKLSNTWLFRNIVVLILSQGWDVSVLSKGEKDVLEFPGVSSVAGVFICRLPWVLLWLNTLNKSALCCQRGTLSAEERHFPFFTGYLNLCKFGSYIFTFYVWGRGIK